MPRKRFEHIELPAKLLDYFLRSDKSNINQFGGEFVHARAHPSIFRYLNQPKVAVTENWYGANCIFKSWLIHEAGF